MKRFVALSVLAGLLSWTSSAHAAFDIADSDSFALNLGGYASGLMGVSQVPYDTLGQVDEFNGLNSSVFRLEWKGSVGEHVSFEVHNRLYWNLTDASLGAGQVGLGATVVPPRTFDMKTIIIEKDGLLFEHDLDRLAVTVFSPVGDFTVGRQAITWGVSSMFVIADIWSQFSPFELDTSQKRGIDAVRHISYPMEGLEMDLIVADRGSWDMLSFGGRWAWTLDSSDQYVAIAKSYRRVWAIMGFAMDLDYFRPYSEVAAAFDLDDEEIKKPRFTIGTDYIRSEFTLSGEYHYNGYGTSDSGEYIEKLTSAEFSRGEIYFVGEHYAGLAASWMPVEYATFILGGTMNILDPSVIISPLIQYEVVQDVNLRFGGYVAIGDYPELRLDPNNPIDVNSEFGSYGNLFFMELSAFF